MDAEYNLLEVNKHGQKRSLDDTQENSVKKPKNENNNSDRCHRSNLREEKSRREKHLQEDRKNYKKRNYTSSLHSSQTKSLNSRKEKETFHLSSPSCSYLENPRNSKSVNFHKQTRNSTAKIEYKNDVHHHLRVGSGFEQRNKASCHLRENDPGSRKIFMTTEYDKNATNSKRKNKISFYELQGLLTKSTGEILLTILNKESGFSMLLNEQHIKRDSMAYVLLTLGKAVDAGSSMDNNINAMIFSIAVNRKFFFESLQSYLASFHLCKSDEYHLNSLLGLSEFLYKFQLSLPSYAAEYLLILLPLLEDTCEKYLKHHDKLYPSITRKLREIKEQNSLVLEKHNANKIHPVSPKEKLQLMNPPENYRSISVLPNATDLLESCTFLRPNIVKGKYQDTEHYLDVQYRLLREDYVKPLRDGIAEYIKLKKRGKSIKHSKDVRMYTDVCIIKQEFVKGGLLHMASFNNSSFSKVNWEFSKRFLTGSLLCMSSDDFKTILFASVACRDAKELKKGLLFLRFEELTDEILNLSPLRKFVIIETSAYFEAYRHNLNALIQLNEATLPMKQYIVETQKIVHNPSYLNESTVYDMQPLFSPLDLNFDNDTMEMCINSYDIAKSVKILNENSWPTSSELNLDPSQYAALKAAITKEFAVIQGPPGTGKTYVGLRIAQLLLHNIQKCQSDIDEKQLPILVICYTNHALDQFLEGLLLFTKKLVRVGGRGNNEAVSPFQLNNLKNGIKRKREVPHYIFSSVKQKFFHVKCVKRDISKIQESFANSSETVLSENKLANYMPMKHYISLKNYPGEDGLMILIWLGIYTNSNNKAIKKSVQVRKSSLEIQREESPYSNIDISFQSDLYNEIEADLEYIEAQRTFTSDEFGDLSYDFPVFGEEDIYQNNLKMEGTSKKRLKQFIKHNLLNNPTMTEYYAMKIDDVWNVPYKDRWCLYKYWFECYKEEKNKECLRLQEELRTEYKKLDEMRLEEDIYVCNTAHVVGMTTTGAAKYRHIVQRLNPKILIVEEAAEILESHIVTSLAPGTKHVILIGDHQQLRPSPTVHSLAVKYDLNVSLFERMVKNGMDCHKLNIQHRMRPEIAALISPYIYDNLVNHESVAMLENIKGVSNNVFFILHAHEELQEYDSKSKVNQHEARFLIKLCQYLILQGYNSSQITVLTTYSGQLFEMKRLSAHSILKGVKFTVVDNYQGEENDIILISFVRSNEDGEIGFLKVANRVCVALSRAKKGLFCIGNFKLLAEKSDLWKNIVNHLETHKSIGPSLQLVCQNHPDVQVSVATEKDFDSVPEGGCTKNCEFRLSCGHVCPLICHHYDREHKEILCQKPCRRPCSNGHLCQKKCFQECDLCTVKIPKTLQKCGHTIEVDCCSSDDNSTDNLCTQLCDKYLPCGHKCPLLCCKPCPLKCVKKVNIESKVCGHQVYIECFNHENEELLTKKCREPCRVELSCGHLCKGTCSKCYQGRLHTACNQPCKRIMVCGHVCQSPCSKSCPPCEYPCENRCIHSKCPKKCGEPCKKCTEPCNWSCPHKNCNSLCGEPCDRTACDEPCLKLLKCKHQCIGLCGEPCPIKCRICDEDEVKEIFFGSEDELDARFIVLEDCKHIFELNGITQWMNHDIQDKREVQMKVCPKCKIVIRKNLRFGNVVKTCLADLEKVKRITYGNPENNVQSQQLLLQRLKEASKTWKLSVICKPLINTLALRKTRSIQAITTIENVVNELLLLLDATQFNGLELLLPFSSGTSIQTVSTKLEDYIKISRRWLIAFIRKEFLTASEQQLQELTWEVHRLKLANRLLISIPKLTNNIQLNKHLDAVLGCIMTYIPFREEEKKKFTTEFDKFIELTGGTKINISDLEKKSILKAMGLSKGHWYQCPNGHVYCITECGGAMVESKCNECGENIGGTRHTLLSSNRVATAMDGAQHSAWSDAMNVENYQF